MKVTTTHDGYLALLDVIYFAGARLGNLSEEGVDVNGDDAQTLMIWSAQHRGGPVKEVQTRAATTEVTGKMIELIPENCVKLIGGSVNTETGGWDAPANTSIVEGAMKILTGTGYTIDIKRASLRMANLRGGLGGDKTLGVDFGYRILTPLDGSSPYSIYPTIPFIEADPTALSFDATGGSKPVEIEASGPFAVGKVPAGFSVEIINGRVTVIAEANTESSQRTGELIFTLQSDTSKTVKVTLTQSAA